MKLWEWYRERPRWFRWALAVPAGLVALAGLYVVARALQYASAEGDAGLFRPSQANVTVRARGLEDHWKRIRGTGAWRAIDRRLLRDRALRQAINGALGEAGLPTLDDLEDVRKARLYSEDTLIRAAGRDAFLALRVGDSWKGASWCAATRLRLTDYLLAPLARWALPSEAIGGYSCLKVRQGGTDLFVSLQGSVAVVSGDRAFLAEALKGRGRREAPERPAVLRVDFGDSRALLNLRREIEDSGLFPFARVGSARGLEAWADIAGTAVFVEARLEGAAPVRSGPPPEAPARLAPGYASGFCLTSAGVRELYAWLKTLAAEGTSKDLREAIRTLGEAGFETGFLPLVEPGLGLILGSEAREGRLDPSVALVIPSRDPRAALEAMNAVIQSRHLAGSQAEARLESHRVGDVEMMAWTWPGGLLLGPVPFNDVLRPCYAALPDAVVLGNNEAFTRAVIERSAGRVEGLTEQGAYRRAIEKLRGYGMPADPPPSGAFLFLPSLRESLDGVLRILAVQMVYAARDDARLRAEIEADLRRQGRTASSEEIVQLFNEAMERRKQDQEDRLRRNLRALDAAEWAAAQVVPSEGGVSVRAVLEFR